MRVKELIAKLNKCDPDLRVLVAPPDECCPAFDNDLYDCAQETLIRDRDGKEETVVSLYYDKGAVIGDYDEDEDEEDSDEEDSD